MAMRIVLGLVCSLIVMLEGSVDYPVKSVRIIEPFGAGGGPDIIARAISSKLTALWGQLVTVENHPGALNTGVVVSAVPLNWNQSGVRGFCSNEDAVIRATPGVTAPTAVATTAACNAYTVLQ